MLLCKFILYREIFIEAKKYQKINDIVNTCFKIEISRVYDIILSFFTVSDEFIV